MKTIILPTIGAIVLVILAGCSHDPNEPMPSSSTTTTTQETTSNSAMPTPAVPPGTTTTTETTETHSVSQ